MSDTASNEWVAEFSQSRNDMYWKVYVPEDGFVRWGGYDDDYWWNNVSKSDRARTRIGEKTGRVYLIDFKTGRVTVSEGVQA